MYLFYLQYKRFMLFHFIQSAQHFFPNSLFITKKFFCGFDLFMDLHKIKNVVKKTNSFKKYSHFLKR